MLYKAFSQDRMTQQNLICTKIDENGVCDLSWVKIEFSTL